jgi:hypothetical protein
MMVDQGFGGGDPKIRFAQLSEALLRDCRYVVGIKLHTKGMTVADGAKVFTEQGFQEPAVAYVEARAGTFNPTYLYYTSSCTPWRRRRAPRCPARETAHRSDGQRRAGSYVQAA